MEFDLGRLLTEESKRMMNCLHEGIFIADKMAILYLRIRLYWRWRVVRKNTRYL